MNPASQFEVEDMIPGRATHAEGAPSVRGLFRYTAHDPCAVHLQLGTFSYPSQAEDWVFGRDLLMIGCSEPTGTGHVRVKPVADADLANWNLVITLYPPGCYATFEFFRPSVMEFLKRTYAVVPPGQESQHLNINGVLTRLLH